MTASGVHTDVLSLPSDQTGTVGSARLVRDRMRMTGSRLCVALGGGSAIDAAKLARAAHHRPWLLDRAIWRRPTGVLALPDSRGPDSTPHLIALSTRPGTAAEVASRVALAPDTGTSRRLLTGGFLRPTMALIDPDWSSTLSREAWFESLNEILFRILGPFLITRRSSKRIDRTAVEWIEEILDIGAHLTDHEYPADGQRLRTAELSVSTATAGHVHHWAPTMPAWWCIQNTVVAHTGLSKGTATSRALPVLLEKIADGEESLGSAGRLRTMEKYRSYEKSMREAIGDFCAAARNADAAHHGRRSDEELVKWGNETLTLWGRHPGIAALGAKGVRDVLQESGF
ncbi:alcohol dehydrogenase YqhD (iron-dependent ADH family) [Spinactinospora alkalitolerans]|uniref:Alcohol dehydrogenase YqhD (Iron-dependent ADH family) n=2 Tax=Spinactinospora alkalitolerans TaxID=687207 RepID=A0A852TXJ3_9ACTN|nr:alcohol dehydrogenase YqhD (iron-dependent ADH family) [Spinactinospora alkalitolerans]